MTINKSQGQSLGRVGVYLNPEVFSHGQLYVALSRTTDPSKLWLADDGAGEDSEGKGLLYGRIKNVVYNEVFSYVLALADPIHSVVVYVLSLPSSPPPLRVR
jgi:hypothetical protein